MNLYLYERELGGLLIIIRFFFLHLLKFDKLSKIGFFGINGLEFSLLRDLKRVDFWMLLTTKFTIPSKH